MFFRSFSLRELQGTITEILDINAKMVVRLCVDCDLKSLRRDSLKIFDVLESIDHVVPHVDSPCRLNDFEKSSCLNAMPESIFEEM